MSIIEVEEAACPSCGAATPVTVHFSINGGRHPDLRAAILDDTLARQQCGACGTGFRPPPRFSYVDTGRGDWILVEPPSALAEWADLEGAAHDIFESTYGSGAPGPARAVGKALSPRVTFGWPAVREKLLCGHLGIDDVALEIVKALILRSGGEIPLGDDVELRLVAADATTLTLLWITASTGAPVEELVAPRGLLADVTAASYTGLRDALTTGPFVDLHRILVEA